MTDDQVMVGPPVLHQFLPSVCLDMWCGVIMPNGRPCHHSRQNPWAHIQESK